MNRHVRTYRYTSTCIFIQIYILWVYRYLRLGKQDKNKTQHSLRCIKRWIVDVRRFKLKQFQVIRVFKSTTWDFDGINKWINLQTALRWGWSEQWTVCHYTDGHLMSHRVWLYSITLDDGQTLWFYRTSTSWVIDSCHKQEFMIGRFFCLLALIGPQAPKTLLCFLSHIFRNITTSDAYFRPTGKTRRVPSKFKVSLDKNKRLWIVGMH